MNSHPDALFECSWEVCNKVGGIWTVISSKAARMKEVYGDKYYAVGPYFLDKIAGQFQELVPPAPLKSVFDELKEQGVCAHYGTWLIGGKPNSILIDFSGLWPRLNDIKKELWEWGEVDSLNGGSDYDEPILWSYATGMLIARLSERLDGTCAGHFHEWLSGAGLLYLRHHNANVGTVFTTHATILGRSMASSGVDIYGKINDIDPAVECHNYHIAPKHSLERASAQQAHIFTTVSEITGIEAEHFLGRKPDVYLPNGLDLDNFPIFEEILIKHRLHRDRIREFCLSYFFPYYTFDLEETLFMFTAARYEVHVKGIDIFIDALSQLNKKLKEENSNKTIVVFFWVPTGVKNIKQEIIENKTFFQDIKDSVYEVYPVVKQRLLYKATEGKQVCDTELFGDRFLDDIKKKQARFARTGHPPLCTHDLHDDNDAIIGRLSQADLLNREEDRVKVVYYPIYLSGADSLIDLDYYESMQGCHLGVFPSYYEPWGYTPLESGALGVPSITTDLSGFGRYFCSDCTQGEYPGVYVIRRFGHSDEEATLQLADSLYTFSSMTREQRTKNKVEARKVAAMVDWKCLKVHYIQAHQEACQRRSS